MKRGVWAALAAGVVLVIVLALVGVNQSRQQTDRAAAWLTLQAYCAAHVYDSADPRCRAWVASALDSGAPNYGAVNACNQQGDFVSCLSKNGFHLPPG